MDWHKSKLEDIANIEYGTRVVKSRDEGSIYPVYGGGGETFKMDKYNRENCVVISRFAMSPLCTRYVRSKIFLNDSGLTVSTKNDTILLQEYLDWCILSRNDEIYALGRGAAQRNLEIPSFKKMIIAYPNDIKEQRRVIEKIKLADEIRQKKKQANEKLDEFLNSTFYHMFGNPQINNKSWNIVTLEKIVSNNKDSIKRGPFGGSLKKEIFKDKGYLVYEQTHAIHNDYDFARYFIDENKYKEMAKFKVIPGDLIISCSGVTLGRISEIPQNAIPGIINQALLKLSLNHDIVNNKYFIALFRNKHTQNKIFETSRGSGIPNMPSVSILKQLEFMIPPIKEQNKFAQIVEKVEKQKQTNERVITQMDNLFNSLSQKAFKGEL